MRIISHFGYGKNSEPKRHDGRLYVRGLLCGVRLLADLLAKRELDEARRLIERAEREARR